MRILGCLGLLLALSACAPAVPELRLPEDCRAEFSTAELVAGDWLRQPDVWRLRQGALLEIGRRTMPLEGFLRLDLPRQQARLLAMNELGVVLFELQVSAEGQELQRAIPQLQRVQGLPQGVAQSLRKIFFQPRPGTDDRLENRANSQRLWRPLADGELGFVFDCRGDLRETRLQAKAADWRVVYDRYQWYGDRRLPGRIVLDDFQQRIKLSLWLHEGKQE
jgi:hypothetical protein